MKTLVNIPYERAPEDPKWMYKRMAGKKLTAEETNEYYEYEFDKNYKLLSKKTI